VATGSYGPKGFAPEIRVHQGAEEADGELSFVIHATHDKAHTLAGYFRYTADGTLISETRSVGIRIYKVGHWGSAGSLGQVTHHDRSNSKT
jgi:hypothetical protein